MISSLSIGPRTLLDDCNPYATAIVWRSPIFSWIIVASAIAELDTGRSASPVLRDHGSFRRFSRWQPLCFGVPPELPYLSSERLRPLKIHFRRPHIIFGIGLSTRDIPLVWCVSQE